METFNYFITEDGRYVCFAVNASLSIEMDSLLEMKRGAAKLYQHYAEGVYKTSKDFDFKFVEMTREEFRKFFKIPPLPNRITGPHNGASQEKLNSSNGDGQQNPSQLKEATILSAEEVLKIINTYDKHIEILDKYIKILNDEIEKTKQLLNK